MDVLVAIRLGELLQEQRLRAELIEEFAIVTDEQSDTAEAAQCASEHPAGSRIDVIGRYIDEQHVRFAPQRRRDLRAFPLAVNGQQDIDRRRCLLLTFNNSKYTGGKMMLAPNAEIADGLIEYVRWGPVGRLGLLSNLPGLYDGTHINQPLASRIAARHIDFFLDSPIDVMVDGEVMTIQCERLDVLPSALNVIA